MNNKKNYDTKYNTGPYTNSHVSLDEEQRNNRKEKLEEIVTNVVLTGIFLGWTYLGVMSIFGTEAQKAQIDYAFKTVLILGPGGTAVGTQIFTGQMDSTVKAWVEYNPKTFNSGQK